MLAAAIFASSVAPGTSPAPVAPAAPPPVVVAPPPAAQVTPPPPAQVFPEDSGDVDFGAPMIETAPVDTGVSDAAAVPAAPGSAEEAGGRQFNARPGRSYPTPM